MALRGSKTNMTPSAMAFTGVWKPSIVGSPSTTNTPSPIKPQRRASSLRTLNSSVYKSSQWKEESATRLTLSGNVNTKADASYGSGANSNTDFIKHARSKLRKL